jgi:hypothetical protein
MTADVQPSAQADMPADTQAEGALTLIRERLRGGVRASPLCLAVMGWLSATPTEPYIADIRRTDEGRVWLRLSDEPELAPLCGFTQFLGQIEVICAALPLDEEQTQQVVAAVRARLR